MMRSGEEVRKVTTDGKLGGKGRKINEEIGKERRA